MMTYTFLSTDSVLQRTAEGTLAISERTPLLASKLRAVLFLIDGNVSVGDLLDRAGSLSTLLAQQLEELVRLESIPSPDVDRLGADILEAKTLRDLAIVARTVTNELALSVGIERSQLFWEDAKTIIMAWRELSLRDEA